MEKKLPFILSLSVFMLIVNSCGKVNNIANDPVPRIGSIRIDPAEVSKNRIKYSSLFDKIEYIQLPTDSNCLIGKVDKLLATDDYLFVMDRKIARSVFVFDNSGNKILQINKTGNGPGEYIDVRDIAFDTNKREVLLRCYMRKKLMYYDLDGNFLRETDIPYHSLRVQPVGDSFALCSDYHIGNNIKQSGKHADLMLADSGMKKLLSTANYFIPPVAKAVVLTSEAQFSRLNDTLFSIKPDHNNIVYHVTPDEIFPAYRLDFGPYSIDERYWKKASERGMTFQKIDTYSNSLNLCESFWFLEGNDYMFFTYKQNGKLYKVIYSKKSGKIKQIENFENDMDKVSMFRPIAIHNDKLYCLVDSEEVFRMRDHLTGVFPENVLNNVKELNNPLISIFTLKPF